MPEPLWFDASHEIHGPETVKDGTFACLYIYKIDKRRHFFRDRPRKGTTFLSAWPNMQRSVNEPSLNKNDVESIWGWLMKEFVEWDLAMDIKTELLKAIESRPPVPESE